MLRALADALVPIFAGLLLGYWGGKQGWLDKKGEVRRRSDFSLATGVASKDGWIRKA